MSEAMEKIPFPIAMRGLNGIVEIRFKEKVEWLGLEASSARQLAVMLHQAADRAETRSTHDDREQVP